MPKLDPHSHTDLDQGSVEHMSLEMTIDPAGRRLTGSVKLRFAAAQAGPLDLDTRDVRVLTVRGGGGDLPFEVGEADPVFGSRLRIDREAPVSTIDIDYQTSTEASALGWLEPQQTAGGQQPFVFSQCQPHHARSIVPCQDSSAVRFTYDARITVPDPLTVVMSAESLERSPGGDGTAVFSFRMPQPIPSYLLAFAAGDLASRDLSDRSRIWAEPSVVEAAAWEFEGIESMIETAETLFGKYDWDRYDMLVLPPSFPYGGMENPRLTFLTPTLLAGDRSLVSVVAHELAHSWTGNLVTNANVEHFWLNEGFTVWAERRILEATEGEEMAALHSAIGRNDLDDAIARFGEQSPLTRLRTELAGIDPDTVYSQVPYEKGFLFLTALERSAGREAWDDFVRSWLHDRRFTSATTEEFLTVLEEALGDAAKAVRAREWLYEPGLPADAPTFPSSRLEAISDWAKKWPERPTSDEVASWQPMELQLYLQRLPERADPADCAALDRDLRLTENGNYEILVEWLLLGVRSGYDGVLPKVRQVLTRVGRMKYLRPLYVALVSRDETRAVAREVFEAAGPTYHAISRAAIREIIA